MTSSASGRYEPDPRWGHASVAHGSKVYVWGGRLDDFSPSSRKTYAAVVNIFDVNTELWEQKPTGGSAPPGLYNNAHAELGGCLYIYGGFDGHHTYNTLHQLELTYLQWKALSKPQANDNAPMKMTGSGMVTCGDRTLVLFGGFGTPSCEVHSGYTFHRQAGLTGAASAKGWTNEIWCYDIVKEEWSCPAVTGDVPPPCADFVFTEIDHDRAVLFGGYQPEIGATADLYLLDMTTWRWTKIEPHSKGISHWPKSRDGHASTHIRCRSRSRSYLVVSGGWDINSTPLDDTWVLDTGDFSWHQLELKASIGPRFWHTITAVGDSPVLTQLLLFGGCPMGGEKWPKLAATVVVELGFFDSDVKWTVIDVIDHGRLGNPLQRMKERLILSEFHSRQFIGSTMSLVAHTPPHTSPTWTPSHTPSKELSPVVDSFPAAHSWSVPKSKVSILKDELGKGKNSITKVAIFQGGKVAAKCLHGGLITESNRAAFVDSLEVLSTLKHPNLVAFLGAILDDANPIILCELVSLSLKALLERSSLPYHHVLGIATDVANALCYLHSIKPVPIVHGDLRSSGVLLESGRGGSYKAKLAGYMTASLVPQVPETHSQVQAMAMATKGHKSPTVTSKKVTFLLEPHNPLKPSPKRDTYNFGLLLVEIATRSSPIDVALTYLMESITWPLVSNVVKRCVESEPAARPSMEEVVAMLGKQEATGHQRSNCKDSSTPLSPRAPKECASTPEHRPTGFGDAPVATASPTSSSQSVVTAPAMTPILSEISSEATTPSTTVAGQREMSPPAPEANSQSTVTRVVDLLPLAVS